MRKPRHIVAYGPQCLLLEWEQCIDPSISRGVHTYASIISQWSEVIACTPAYASLLVGLSEPRMVNEIRERIYSLKMLDEYYPLTSLKCLPVCYGGDLGPDLSTSASLVGMDESTYSGKHAAESYLVYQLGYVPGFAFLGRLPEELSVPRLVNPRTKVPVGSVAVAGRQTAIYPSAVPGGWRIIGRCPLPLLNETARHATDLAVLQPGEMVKFVAIKRKEFDRLLKNPEIWTID